jgi:hypothetical protein
MHLTFDCINGIEAPISLPPSLIPANKTHLLPQQQQYPQQTGYQQPQPTGYQGYQPTGYQQAQPTGYYAQPQQQPQYTGFPQQEAEFSWDMTSDEMTSYQNIYAKYANDTGKVKFSQMDDFYSTLGLPRTDLTNAW